MSATADSAARIAAARAWLAACSMLSVYGAFRAWPSFWDTALHSDGLAKALASYGVPSAAAIGRSLLFAGVAVRSVVFVACAVHLAWFGRLRVFPLVLAAGVVAMGVGIGFPSVPSPEHRWLTELNTLIAVGTLALVTLTFPSGRFDSGRGDTGRRIAYFVSWLLVLWLFLYPVGLSWDALRASPAARGWIHVGLLVGGLAAAASRYARLGRAERVQMQWVFSGITASVGALAFRTLLGASIAGELFARVVYPVVQCFSPVAFAVALGGGPLVWKLEDILARFIRKALFGAAVGALSLLLGRVAVPLWTARHASPLGAVLACVGFSLIVTWVAGESVLRLATYAVFPGRGDRERAIRLSVGALEDALDLKQALWAIEGIVELGWPGSRVEIYRDVVHGPAAFGSDSLPPDAAENHRRPIGGRKRIAARWSKAFTLHVPGTDPATAPGFGQMRVIPPRGAGFSEDDLALLQEKVVGPVAVTIWRVQAMERLLESPPRQVDSA